ncbi:acyl carrier protein [Micromonospora sp. RP3T]|uniref:acyl carrier protein n=1 Tax=Micromonospora sp. RP3T TaxID=2135446 RepID=UPI003D7518EE
MNEPSEADSGIDPGWPEEAVARLVGALAPQPTATVTPGQTLVTELGYDSLLLVQLSFELEDLFSVVPVGPEDAPPIGSVGEVQNYVVSKIRQGQAIVPEPGAVTECLRRLADGPAS